MALNRHDICIYVFRRERVLQRRLRVRAFDDDKSFAALPLCCARVFRPIPAARPATVIHRRRTPLSHGGRRLERPDGGGLEI